METTFVPENVTFSPGRVFINPSSFGCGSGCTYCYTKGFRDMQVVIKEDELVKSIKFIKNNPDFITGKNGTLISLSPDTDPFKTEESTKLTCIILENFLTIGNPIQISTKEIIPKVALEIIQKKRKYREQVVIFVSIATISKAKNIEPHAASVANRFQNFSLLRDNNVLSCLYMKPVIHSTIIDKELYLDEIKKCPPDTICLGAIYTKTNKDGSFTHPAHQDDEGLTSSGITHEITSLRETFIKETKIPVFYTSVCVSAYWRDSEPQPKIWSEYSHLCVSCRDCHKKLTS